jgi:heme-degrading monooxygenase HmoA
MVEFINCFAVGSARDEGFVEMWRTVNAHMVTRPGYVGHRLHRSLRPDAAYRFVNTAQWESVEAWQAAHDADFRALATGPRWEGITATPALYEIVHEGAAR